MKAVRNDTYFDLIDTKTMRCLGTAVVQAEPVMFQSGVTTAVKFLCEIKLDSVNPVVVSNENL